LRINMLGHEGAKLFQQLRRSRAWIQPAAHA
jgi:hypothetical protein